jgi:hypothetical protein
MNGLSKSLGIKVCRWHLWQLRLIISFNEKHAQQDLQQLEEDVIRSLALGHTANACVLAASG